MKQENSLDLGTCCCCGGTENCTNVIYMTRRAPIAGTGWGCIVCGMPPDGAVAVACDACMDESNTDRKLRFVCNGFLLGKERISVDAYPKEHFDHNEMRHPENAYKN